MSQWSWGFHTVRGGIDPGDRRFRPRVVGVVDVWKIFYAGMGPYPPGVVLAHPGSMGSRQNHPPLAWIWTWGSANIMPILYLKCEASSNAGFTWLVDRLGMLSCCCCCCVAVLRDCNPAALQLTNLMLFCVVTVIPQQKLDCDPQD